MVDQEIQSIDDAQGWLRACSLVLADQAELRLGQRSCAKLARTLARISRLIGEAQGEPSATAQVDTVYGDFLAFAQSGVPPVRATTEMRVVELPEAGPNVVALVRWREHRDCPR